MEKTHNSSKNAILSRTKFFLQKSLDKSFLKVVLFVSLHFEEFCEMVFRWPLEHRVYLIWQIFEEFGNFILCFEKKVKTKKEKSLC